MQITNTANWAGSAQWYLISTQTGGLRQVEAGKGQKQVSVQLRQTNPKEKHSIADVPLYFKDYIWGEMYCAVMIEILTSSALCWPLCHRGKKSLYSLGTQVTCWERSTNGSFTPLWGNVGTGTIWCLKAKHWYSLAMRDSQIFLCGGNLSGVRCQLVFDSSFVSP